MKLFLEQIFLFACVIIGGFVGYFIDEKVSSSTVTFGDKVGFFLLSIFLFWALGLIIVVFYFDKEDTNN